MKLVSLVVIIFGIAQIECASASPISSATSSKTQLRWGSPYIAPASAESSTSSSNSGASSPFSSSSSTSSWIPISSSGGKSIQDPASSKNRRDKYVAEFQSKLSPKKFINKSNQKELYHINKNHECDRCGNTFVSNGNLFMHKLQVHKLDY